MCGCVKVLLLSALLVGQISLGQQQQEENGSNFPSELGWDLSMRVISQAGNGGNTVFAPTSVVTALGMLHQGLAGDTRREVGEALGFPQDEKELRRQFKKSSSRGGEDDALQVSNMVIVLQAAKIKSSYAKTMKEVFGALPFQHGFKKRPEIAAGSINAKVAEATGGNIKDLMPPGSITAQTKFVLANAVHFKSPWATKFEKEETVQEDFTTSSGDVKTVDMMVGQQNNAGYLKTEDEMEVLELPLDEQDYSFVIVMARKGASVVDLESGMLGLKDKILDPVSLPRVPTMVHLPKFSASTRLRMREQLSSQFGAPVERLFEAGSLNDFSNMAQMSDGFYLDEVHHRSVMSIDEDGVEASGATGLAVTLYSFFEPEAEVRVDRTFAALIVDNKAKEILFAGIIGDPTIKPQS